MGWDELSLTALDAFLSVLCCALLSHLHLHSHSFCSMQFDWWCLYTLDYYYFNHLTHPSTHYTIIILINYQHLINTEWIKSFWISHQKGDRDSNVEKYSIFVGPLGVGCETFIITSTLWLAYEWMIWTLYWLSTMEPYQDRYYTHMDIDKRVW